MATSLADIHGSTRRSLRPIVKSWLVPPLLAGRSCVESCAASALKHQLEKLLGVMGAHPILIERSLYLGKEIPINGTAHQSGTCRFGTDPETSVLDLDCKAHELDNLYVTDASFFPSIGAVNPTLTIIANALRVADHLKSRLHA